MRRFFPVLALALALASAAQASTPEDFAFGAKLHLPTGGSLYVLDLPNEVYAGILRPDLSDVRVFNGAGEPVPHQVRAPQDVTARAIAPVAVPFYPLTEAGLTKPVDVDARGTIVGFAPEPDAEHPFAYLIDLSQNTEPADALELEWTRPPEVPGFMAQARVEGSNDLLTWSAGVTEVTVAELPFGKHRLMRQRIELPRQPAKYLRVAWEPGAQGVALNAVRLHFHVKGTPVSREKFSVPGIPDATQTGLYTFDTQGFRPLSCVELLLPEEDTLVQATLTSSLMSAGPWNVRFNGLLYELRLDGTLLRNGPLCFPSSVDRYWRLQLDAASEGIGSGRPTLELAWAPHRLVFVPRGEGPFTLAWGSARVDGEPVVATDPAFAQVAANGETPLVRPASLGDRVTLGGLEALQPAPKWTWSQAIGAVAAMVGIFGFVRLGMHARRERARRQTQV